MTCTHCGRDSVHIRYFDRLYGKGENALIIRNVPVVTCRSCGDAYLLPDTLREIDRLMDDRKQLATKQMFDVVSFASTNEQELLALAESRA